MLRTLYRAKDVWLNFQMDRIYPYTLNHPIHINVVAIVSITSETNLDNKLFSSLYSQSMIFSRPRKKLSTVVATFK